MNSRKRFYSFICVALPCILVGCSTSKEAPLEKVRIVEIGNCHEIGEVDHYTVVEFPDGERRIRHYHYGKVGEEFYTRK